MSLTSASDAAPCAHCQCASVRGMSRVERRRLRTVAWTSSGAGADVCGPCCVGVRRCMSMQSEERRDDVRTRGMEYVLVLDVMRHLGCRTWRSCKSWVKMLYSASKN